MIGITMAQAWLYQTKDRPLGLDEKTSLGWFKEI